MSKLFRGIVTRDITESATIEVRSSNPDEAACAILTLAREPSSDVNWEINDGSEGIPYYGDPACDVEEIVSPARYDHDCAQCILLGQFQEYDLYYCTKQGYAATVVARFGDDGPDYTSGQREMPTPAVQVGWFMADAAGLTTKRVTP